jgi:D-alanyl-D-alanine carboxypeptidase (penicillin-binding protein 5/6)
MIKNISKNGAMLLIAIIGLIAIIFVFSEPTQAPSLNLNNNSISTEIKDPTENTFITLKSDSKIGEGIVADSFLIYDENSKVDIASKNPDTAVAIASLTKLMTAYVTQKYGQLTDVWAINSAGLTDIRPVLNLVVGDKVLVSDLVDGMLIGSANDAAKTLGVYLTTKIGKPMVEIMNSEAKSLGMTSTHYENPIGFDSEQNYSTASDLKLLVEKVRALPLFSDLDRKQSYSFTSESGQTYSVKATNTLLAADPEIHAIKTGFTDEAKGAMITAVYHDNKKFVIIVLGSTKREEDTKLLKQQVIAALK